MKTRLTTLISAFIMLTAAVSFGQNAMVTHIDADVMLVALTGGDFNGIGIKSVYSTDITSANAIDNLDYLQADMIAYPYGTVLNNDKCASFTRMRKAGTALVIGGAVGMGVGVILITGTLISKVAYDGDTPIAVLYVGTVLAALGGTALATGIPLKIIGKKKSRQYCSSPNSMLYVKSSNNGLGLQYRF